MPQSKSDIHLTPDRVYDMIKEQWGYSKDDMFDPCPVNPQWNGLLIDWKKINYVNPPYSNLPDWVSKAIAEANTDGNITIMLLPSKTDQTWFHWIINHDYKIIWIHRRLKFKNNKWSAPQPHFLVEVKQ